MLEQDDVPLAPLTPELATSARLIERSIERYLASTSKDLKAKSLMAQELLRRVGGVAKCRGSGLTFQ